MSSFISVETFENVLFDLPMGMDGEIEWQEAEFVVLRGERLRGPRWYMLMVSSGGYPSLVSVSSFSSDLFFALTSGRKHLRVSTSIFAIWRSSSLTTSMRAGLS